VARRFNGLALCHPIKRQRRIHGLPQNGSAGSRAEPLVTTGRLDSPQQAASRRPDEPGLVKDLLNHATEPMGDGANGLGVPEARDEAATHDREDGALCLHSGVRGA
jgi:hypothetical protein